MKQKNKLLKNILIAGFAMMLISMIFGCGKAQRTPQPPYIVIDKEIDPVFSVNSYIIKDGKGENYEFESKKNYEFGDTIK